jgi:hypothetical protein
VERAAPAVSTVLAVLAKAAVLIAASRLIDLLADESSPSKTERLLGPGRFSAGEQQGPGASWSWISEPPESRCIALSRS